MSAGVPKLRFPEFREEWSKQKLSAVMKVKGKRNKDLRFGPKQVLSVSGEHGVVNQISHLGRSYAGVSVAPYHIVEKGDIVYTKSPLKTSPFGIVKANRGSDGIVSTLYAVYEVRPGHHPFFWDRYFELTDRTNRYLKPLVNKGAKNDMKISNERVLIDHVIAPTHSEQRKISVFFDSVDAKIDALRRQQAALTRFKAGLAQKMFSQELRFTREDRSAFPDWESLALGEFVNFSKGAGVSKADIDPGGSTPCIRYGELYTTYGAVIDDVRSRTSVPANKLVISVGNEVLIPSSGETAADIATASVLMHAGVAIGGDLNVLRSNQDGRFLAEYLRSELKTKIASLSQGNSVVHLYAAQLACLAIKLPSLDEQSKIADALSGLDAKISAVGAQIAQMETFKKGLLEQMFA